jgi:hypothetical protein
MCKSYPKANFAYFEEESFSKREAWCWLVENAHNCEIHCPIRYMASQWRWHRSKVERFIKRLKNETVIETAIKAGKLVITICNYETFTVKAIKAVTSDATPIETVLRQNQDKVILNSRMQDRSDNGTDQGKPDSSTIVETNSSQEQDSIFEVVQAQDKNCWLGSQEISALQSSHEPGLRQFPDISAEKEEKKKSTKKRKEEKIKEKNIPYRDTKKEKNRNFVPVQLVEKSDVEDWANHTLPISVDLDWELGKFSDYWLSSRRKPPKDGVAAFRNWLRKGIEFKNYGERNGKWNHRSERTNGVQNFLSAGAELAAQYARSRLDRCHAWKE